MLRVFVLVALVLVLTLPASAQRDQQDRPGGSGTILGDGLIVPGQRVGPVALGMSIAQILQIMPSGYKRDIFPEEKIVLYQWWSQGFWVSTDAQKNTIRIISVFGTGDYHTDKGIYLLNPESKVLSVYGSGYKKYEYPKEGAAPGVTVIRYVPLGLQFGIVNEPSNGLIHGRVFQIGVFEPRKEPPLAKAAMRPVVNSTARRRP
jgi:hypothetical protein